jgi:Ribbon-helix-helix protein, copG family
MIRAQIVLDEPTADRLRVVSENSNASMSEIVRQALMFYFEHREPDASWIGSLRSKTQPKMPVSHDLADIRASVAAGRKRERKL